MHEPADAGRDRAQALWHSSGLCLARSGWFELVWLGKSAIERRRFESRHRKRSIRAPRESSLPSDKTNFHALRLFDYPSLESRFGLAVAASLGAFVGQAWSRRIASTSTSASLSLSPSPSRIGIRLRISSLDPLASFLSAADLLDLAHPCDLEPTSSCRQARRNSIVDKSQSQSQLEHQLEHRCQY